MTEAANPHVSVIRDYLRDKSNPPVELGPDDDVFALGALDSLGIADLIAFLETRNGIEIEMCDVTVENFATLRAMSAYIERRLAER